MQVTLVSYYGEKSGKVLEFIRCCQDELSRLLLSAFRPYEVEQVHATIIGLEGCRLGGKIRNENFGTFYQEERFMSAGELLDVLRSNDFPSFDIRIGGYRHHEDYGFLSQSRHPYLRSFSVQGSIAVAMGWPYDEEQYSDVLERLRRRFNELNILHRWHRKPSDEDNDFYFVLGRVDRRFVSDIQIKQVEEQMRLFLTGVNDLKIPVTKDALSIVGFLDTQLPPQTSVSFKIGDAELTESRLLKLYPTCEGAA
jgi:hypothetical protein